jgi:hypothetical protein
MFLFSILSSDIFIFRSQINNLIFITTKYNKLNILCDLRNDIFNHDQIINKYVWSPDHKINETPRFKNV